VQKLLPDGKGPIYRNVTKEYAPQIAKAEGKSFAAAAGKEGVGGEDIFKLSMASSVEDAERIISGIDFNNLSSRDISNILMILIMLQ